MESLERPDAVLIGAGIMSVTLASLLKRLDPSMEIAIYEVLDSEAQESSNEMTGETTEVETKFVFIGAGGSSLPLLQKSGIPEAGGYAGFPVSGIWLRCDDPAVTSRHNAKVYGKASVGSPPMSVPHLDSTCPGEIIVALRVLRGFLDEIFEAQLVFGLVWFG